MTVVKKYQGDDIPITISSTTINIDDLDEMYVFVILSNHNKEEVVKSFSKAGAGIYQALRKVTSYIYVADWFSGDTKDAKYGQYKLAINYVEPNIIYQSSEENTITSDIVLNLHKSLSNIKSVSSG